MQAERAPDRETGKYSLSSLRSREFLGPVSALGGMQLVATMDGTAYPPTFGGLILMGGRLGDPMGRKRTFIVGVALSTGSGND
jgi:MFS family permease